MYYRFLMVFGFMITLPFLPFVWVAVKLNLIDLSRESVDEMFGGYRN